MDSKRTKIYVLQCRINFIASQIRENRIEHHRLLRELKHELKDFDKNGR